MHTEILTVETPDSFQTAVKRAAELLIAGQIVAIPTETVYGLAGNIHDEKALSMIFQVKGRPSGNPLIVHVSSMEMARECVGHWPERAESLARRFWPGALTLVLEKSAKISPIITAGGSTVALRLPSHPFMQAVIMQCGFPLAAPSANLSNRLSPTTAYHVRQQLWGKVPMIVDAGAAAVGIESTVVDLTSTTPRVLRPGMITERHIREVTDMTGNSAQSLPALGEPLKSPGLLEKHYAPRARLRILKWDSDHNLWKQIVALGINPSKTHVVAYDKIPQQGSFAEVFLVPHDPEAYARALYAELHHCDEAGAETIIVEQVPETLGWEGIRDRLKRAAH